MGITIRKARPSLGGGRLSIGGAGGGLIGGGLLSEARHRPSLGGAQRVSLGGAGVLGPAGGRGGRLSLGGAGGSLLLQQQHQHQHQHQRRRSSLAVGGRFGAGATAAPRFSLGVMPPAPPSAQEQVAGVGAASAASAALAGAKGGQGADGRSEGGKRSSKRVMTAEGFTKVQVVGGAYMGRFEAGRPWVEQPPLHKPRVVSADLTYTRRQLKLTVHDPSNGTTTATTNRN